MPESSSPLVGGGAPTTAPRRRSARRGSDWDLSPKNEERRGHGESFASAGVPRNARGCAGNPPWSIGGESCTIPNALPGPSHNGRAATPSTPDWLRPDDWWGVVGKQSQVSSRSSTSAPINRAVRHSSLHSWSRSASPAMIRAGASRATTPRGARPCKSVGTTFRTKAAIRTGTPAMAGGKSTTRCSRLSPSQNNQRSGSRDCFEAPASGSGPKMYYRLRGVAVCGATLGPLSAETGIAARMTRLDCRMTASMPPLEDQCNIQIPLHRVNPTIMACINVNMRFQCHLLHQCVRMIRQRLLEEMTLAQGRSVLWLKNNLKLKMQTTAIPHGEPYFNSAQHQNALYLEATFTHPPKTDRPLGMTGLRHLGRCSTKMVRGRPERCPSAPGTSRERRRWKTLLATSRRGTFCASKWVQRSRRQDM